MSVFLASAGCSSVRVPSLGFEIVEHLLDLLEVVWLLLVHVAVGRVLQRLLLLSVHALHHVPDKLPLLFESWVSLVSTSSCRLKLLLLDHRLNSY